MHFRIFQANAFLNRIFVFCFRLNSFISGLVAKSDLLFFSPTENFLAPSAWFGYRRSIFYELIEPFPVVFNCLVFFFKVVFIIYFFVMSEYAAETQKPYAVLFLAFKQEQNRPKGLFGTKSSSRIVRFKIR